MTRTTRLAISLAAVFSTGGAFAQAPEAPSIASVTATTTTASVAHVYIGTGSHIAAYSAAANGKLTAVPGSPFNDSLSLQGANGHFLFGFEPSGPIIDSFSMAANGALKKTATLNFLNSPSGTCGPFVENGMGLRIDHSGADLYNMVIGTEFPCPSVFQSFKINDANGKLTSLGYVNGVLDGSADLHILGNNKFAYAPSCAAAFGNSPFPDVVAFQRASNGELVASSAGVALPAPPLDDSDPSNPTPGYYCPSDIATDPTNHAAITLYALEDEPGEDGGNVGYGPMVIATFTADAKGNLTTTNTTENTAKLPWWPNTMRMSPSGKLLAVGANGVILFHFNGGSPLTKYKTLLSGDSIGQILWDNNNHMYVTGSDAKGAKLWVYTVTTTSVTLAPGSPYSVSNASGMVVQPL
jgi:hypothetical protein